MSEPTNRDVRKDDVKPEPTVAQTPVDPDTQLSDESLERVAGGYHYNTMPNSG